MSEKQFSAGGIVIKGEELNLRILLIKDRFGYWTWPKGHVEKGETREEAAIREIREETGLKKLEVMREVGKQEYYFEHDGKTIFKTVHIFLMRFFGEEPLKIQTQEISDARWYMPEQALETIQYEGSKEIIEKALTLI
ncbi:MAG: NUDIX hydrolase [Candidatus Omnitrophota bacterium]|nr:NUDIX hydrolase [Candidatus Omnitrophota bacterium]